MVAKRRSSRVPKEMRMAAKAKRNKKASKVNPDLTVLAVASFMANLIKGIRKNFCARILKDLTLLLLPTTAKNVNLCMLSTLMHHANKVNIAFLST